MLQRIKTRVAELNRHPLASHFLFWLSFFESSVSPLPPDTLLVPMVLSQPTKWQRLAFITTISSILGGLLGYAMGAWAYPTLAEPFLQARGYEGAFNQVQSLFQVWGFWLVLFAAVTPIPYKVFTIAAGVANMSLPVFIIGSILGRGLRFYGVAGITRFGHQKYMNFKWAQRGEST